MNATVYKMRRNKVVALTRLFLMIGMLICFLIIVQDSFHKFSDGKTLISESLIVQDQPEPLPAFSICTEPAFNYGYMESTLGISPYLFLLKSTDDYPTNSSLLELWTESSLRPDMMVVGNDRIFKDQYVWRSNETEYFEIMNSLWFGSCTAFKPMKPKRPNEMMVVMVMYSSPAKAPTHLELILHETPGARLSLIPGDFLSSGSKKIKFKLGEMTMLGIKKEKKIYHIQRKNGKCTEYGNDGSQAKCKMDMEILPRFLNETLANQLCQEAKKSFTHYCLIPQMINYGLNLTECQTKEDYECMKTLMLPPVYQEKEKCLNPCTETFFTVNTKSNPYPTPNVGFVLMHYQTDKIALLEEELVFDFASGLVSIGGALGLFIGFSFLQFFQWMLEEVLNFVEKVPSKLF